MSTWWRTLWPGRLRHESGIPVETDADAVLTALQPLLAVLFVVMCLATVRPLGGDGRGLATLVLILVNGVLMFPRTLFEARVDLRRRMVLAAVAAPLAGALWGLNPYSWAESFSFAVVIHAGVRFEARVATAIAASCAVVAMGVLALRPGPDVPPFWVGALMVLALPFGMLRRDRRRQLATADALVVQTRKAAAGEARAELARELHDVLAHSLSGVNMQLSMADALFEAGRTEQGRAALKQAQGLVVEGLGEARRAVSMLREGTLEVVPAIEAMLTGPGETLTVAGPVELSDAETQAVVRVAQEALTNARRHAPGARVHLTLTGGRLEIRNGPAIQRRTEEQGSGLGLVGMRERAAAIGATLRAEPVPDGGWSVVLELTR